MPVLPSYRNQSIDFLRKSTDWFLYEGNTGISCVEMKSKARIYFLYLCLLLKTTLSCSAMHSVWFPVTISLLLKILKNFADYLWTKFTENQFFYQRYILRSETTFGNWKPFNNDKNCFLFHLKSSFCIQDI